MPCADRRSISSWAKRSVPRTGEGEREVNTYPPATRCADMISTKLIYMLLSTSGQLICERQYLFAAWFACRLLVISGFGPLYVPRSQSRNPIDSGLLIPLPEAPRRIPVARHTPEPAYRLTGRANNTVLIQPEVRSSDHLPSTREMGNDCTTVHACLDCPGALYCNLAEQPKQHHHRD